jgi:hypothetical protein
MSNRIVYRVTPIGNSRLWHVLRGSLRPLSGPSAVVSQHRFKIAAIASARALAKAVRRSGGLSQVVIHGRNGRIQLEWTYGADPKRSKG